MGDSDETGGVVRIGVNRAQAVDTSRETICDRLRYDTVDRSAVNPLEERENAGILGCSRRERANALNSEMSVADDVTLGVDLLGSSVIVGLGVDEVAGLKVVDRHLDGERGVGGDVLTVHRGHKFG